MTPKRFLFVIILIVVLLAAGGVGYYLWSHDTFDRKSTTATDSKDLTEDDIDDVIEAVSKHIILPQDEEPVAAKIIDVDELLKTQPFYRGAINGDILLIYQTSAKAILYSPSRDMLVNVGPIIVDENADAIPVDTEVTEEGSTDDAQ